MKYNKKWLEIDSELCLFKFGLLLFFLACNIFIETFFNVFKIRTCIKAERHGKGGINRKDKGGKISTSIK